MYFAIHVYVCYSGFCPDESAKDASSFASDDHIIIDLDNELI
jgi:hypothetical protein